MPRIKSLRFARNERSANKWYSPAMGEALAFDTHKFVKRPKWMIGALIAQTGVIAGLVLGFSGP